jgi:hypothetical protein
MQEFIKKVQGYLLPIQRLVACLGLVTTILVFAETGCLDGSASLGRNASDVATCSFVGRVELKGFLVIWQ